MTYLRVMSERVMIRGIEGPLRRLMDKVEGRVRRQPGLLSYKTLVDVENPNNYCVLTKWKSEDHLNKWLSDDWYLETTRELDKVSEQPAKYKIFKSPHEDVFLL